MRYYFPPILVIFLSYLCYISKGFLFNGHQIRDLYTNDSETFLSDLAYWTPTAVRHKVSYCTCDGTLLAAGFDVLGFPDTVGGTQGMNFRRTYSDLPDHNIIYYTISLWLIDSWDPPDYFQIEFDSVLVKGWSVGFGNFTGNFCGQEIWPDLMNMTIFGRVSHSGSSVTLKIISELDDWAYDESLGFRDVSLTFAKTTETNVNERCGLSSLHLPSDECSCSYGEYLDDIDTLSCQACDSSCRSCFGGTSKECLECQAGYSFDGSECIKCDESCAVCSGPERNQCVGCPEGMSLFQDGTCVSGCTNITVDGTVEICNEPCQTGKFYFSENQTCSDECNSPWMVDPFMTGVQVCANPCPGGYVFWDGTCNSLCPFEATQLDYEVAICNVNCGFNEVVYWDGSCNSTCDSPLVLSIYKYMPFCQHPCSDTTEFIYWNGSCGNDCLAPYVGSSDERAYYCNLPCGEGQFLSMNGSTCLESCSEPFIIREENGINYCEFPCESTSDYLYWNGSCIDSCPSPYKASSSASGMKFCCYLCEQYGDYYYPVDGECLPTCDAPFTPEIQIVDDDNWYVACVNKSESVSSKDDSDEDSDNNNEGPFYYPITAARIASEKVVGVFIALDTGLSLLSDSHLMILILIIKILNYIKYMNIRVPPQLVQEFNTYNHNHFYLNFGPSMSEGLREKFTNNNLPMVFERAGLHSRFLVNFFKPISSFLIMLGFMVMIAILKRIFSKKTAPILMKIILRRLETYFRWNLVVLLVICNIDEITLYSILEWKTESIDSAQDFFSLVASLIMFALAGLVILAPFYLLNRLYNTRFKVLSNLANEPYFELLKKIEGFQVLWKDFKDASGPQKAFMSIYILRIGLMYLIVASLYKHPLAQMILIFSMSLGMLIFMSIVKPFMKNLDFIQSLAYEVSMLISIGSTLILAILDQTHTRVDQLWLFLGDIIQFCHILVTLTSVVIFLTKFYREVQSVKEFYRSLPKPITRQQFWVLVLEENDPITHELKRNKRTSTKLDLTYLEKEIQRKNLASYNVSVSYSPDGPGSQSVSMMDENRPIFTPTKVEMKIRRSLFKIRKLSSEEEGSPMKTISTFDGEKSPSTADSLKLSNKFSSQNEIKKTPSDPPPEEENEEKVEKKSYPEIVPEENSESDSAREKKIRWKGLETIKEVDSMEISRIKSGEQTRRLANMLQETLRGDLGLLNILNKKLSSETRKTEETVIVKEKEDLWKKKETIEEDTVQESMFE